MKKFLKKYKNILFFGGVTLLAAACLTCLYFHIRTTRTGPSKICAFSKTPTPTSTIDPKIQEFGLKIDKLDILVPIVKEVDGDDKTAYNEALKGGVAHYKGTALPGEGNNVFIFGHSSAEVKTDYAKTFAKLNDLEKGDEIIVYYQNNEHKYKVKNKEIVEATDLSVLKKSKEEILTLMTCWPIGTKDKRLIIRAEKQ